MNPTIVRYAFQALFGRRRRLLLYPGCSSRWAC